MKIAFIGQRGVPATYGGIERHVEELGARLAARGHDVTVWCRTNYGTRQEEGRHRGMHLRYLRTIDTKQLDAIVPSVVAASRSGRTFDVVHFHAIGPGVAAPLSRLRRRTLVVQTIHGLDHERAKWGGKARFLLRRAAWVSAHVPHEVVVVSEALAEHYRAVYNRATTMISNGVVTAQTVPPGPTLEALGLRPGRYALFVGRLVPEKAPDLLVRAFAAIADPEARLVLVGDSSYTDALVDELRRASAADPRIILAGYRYGDELAELYTNAGAFVLPSLLEGLPLTLLEAASYGLAVVASDIAPHVEVLATSRPGGRLVTSGDQTALSTALTEALAGGPAVVAGAAALRRRVHETYSWDRATDQLEALYRKGLTRLRR